MKKSFNPHTYMRCDVTQILIRNFLYVSIHTPTWGVTMMVANTKGTATVSIHTPTWGVTIKSQEWTQKDKFQSTHLHEVWHHRQQSASTIWSFNPHTYMRCDFLRIGGIKHQAGFNPHTYMRCDSGIVPTNETYWVSIHTPTWGVTNGSFAIAFSDRFQSTHLHEVWHTHTNTYTVWTQFQSTHLHEVWL